MFSLSLIVLLFVGCWTGWKILHFEGQERRHARVLIAAFARTVQIKTIGLRFVTDGESAAEVFPEGIAVLKETAQRDWLTACPSRKNIGFGNPIRKRFSIIRVARDLFHCRRHVFGDSRGLVFEANHVLFGRSSSDGKQLDIESGSGKIAAVVEVERYARVAFRIEGIDKLTDSAVSFSDADVWTLAGDKITRVLDVRLVHRSPLKRGNSRIDAYNDNSANFENEVGAFSPAETEPPMTQSIEPRHRRLAILAGMLAILAGVIAIAAGFIGLVAAIDSLKSLIVFVLGTALLWWGFGLFLTSVG
jgi:hypothetical protein